MTDSSEKKGFSNPQDVFDMLGGFQKSRVLLTAYELGIFTALGGEKKKSEDVAEAVAADPRATDRLMNALVAIGLLEKSGGLFSNTPFAAQFLVKDSPAFMAGLAHMNHLWDSWSTMTAAVRAGRSVSAKHIDDRGDKWLTAFIAAMHARAYRSAPGVVALIDLTGVSRTLDLGGGSAAYSMAFVRARDGITGTVYDLPNVLPITRGYIEREGLADKIDTVTGDFNVNPIPGGYDLHFMSAIIHSNSPEQNEALMKKSAAALNPGGQCVVQDFIMDEDRTSPEFGAIFALNMLVGTECGDTFTEAETAGWMIDAGLRDISRIDTQVGTALIIGRKPA